MRFEVSPKEKLPSISKTLVPRGIADIVEIIVLAAGATHFCAVPRAHSAPLDAGEEILELDHPALANMRSVIARHEGDDGTTSCPFL